MAEPQKRMRRVVKKDRTEIETAIIRLDALDVEATQVNRELKEQREAVQAMMKDRVAEVVLDDGRTIRVTVVSRTNRVFNTDKLKKKLGAMVYNKYTSRTFDQAKLDAAVKAGDVPAQVVASCVEETPGGEHIRLTKH